MKEYIVNRGGVELTMRLSEETAKQLKARPIEVPEADSPEDVAEPKSRAPRNKARTPANKSK